MGGAQEREEQLSGDRGEEGEEEWDDEEISPLQRSLSGLPPAHSLIADPLSRG